MCSSFQCLAGWRSGLYCRSAVWPPHHLRAVSLDSSGYYYSCPAVPPHSWQQSVGSGHPSLWQPSLPFPATLGLEGHTQCSNSLCCTELWYRNHLDGTQAWKPPAPHSSWSWPWLCLNLSNVARQHHLSGPTYSWSPMLPWLSWSCHSIQLVAALLEACYPLSSSLARVTS